MLSPITMCRSRKDTKISSLQSSKNTSRPSSKSLTTSNTCPSDNEIASTSSSSSSIHSSLREGPILYPFFDISSAATLTPLSSSTFRCTLGDNNDVVILRRPFLSPDPDSLSCRLTDLCRGHHRSIVRLLGASLAADHIYLVYKYTPGANLATCLRHPRNPNFTLVPTWLSRIQVLSDVSHAMQYIHHQSFTIHNQIKPSAIIVTEPDLRAKLCYFGAADLAGEVAVNCRSTMRTNSRQMKIDGTRGYMAPEILAGERGTQKSDVFAVGVVILQVISGDDQPMKYVMNGNGRDIEVVSVVESARAALGEGRMREWVDRRMGDSFPVEVVEKVVRVGLRCVDAEAGERPDMVWVAGKVSRLLLESKAWAEKVGVPTGISVSFGPR